jgi:hypothetical protein
MSEILYAGRIDSAGLASLITDCHFADNALVLMEQFPLHVISKSDREQLLSFTSYAAGNIPFADYTAGRIFHEDAELRWERLENSLRVVYIGSAANESILRDHHLKSSDGLERCSREFTSYYLYGERLGSGDLKYIGPDAQPGDFATLRIPRILRYPVGTSTANRVRIKVCSYLEKSTGQTLFFRFHSLDPDGNARSSRSGGAGE